MSKTKDYRYDLDECFVENKRSLEAFRSKRLEWKSWLDDDEHHAIWPTLLGMVFRDVSFASIAELARSNPSGPLTTSLIAEAIIHGHVAQQILAIRRLTDANRQNISLRRLLIDVKNNSHLLTRENLICFDGLPYDYQAVIDAEFRTQKPGVAYWVATEGPMAGSTSRMRHEWLDRLIGNAPDNRSRQDRIKKSVFVQLEKILDQSNAVAISKWSHAFLAHAGSPLRRQEVESTEVTNDRISSAIRELVRITEFISNNILGIGGYRGAVMPTAQYDVFENLHHPVASTAQQGSASELWMARSREWDSCLEDIETLLQSATDASK